MKKFLSVFLSLILILVILNVVNFSNVGAEAITPDILQNEYTWVNDTTVYSSSIGGRYFRTKVLNDGTVGAIYYRSGLGNYFAKSYDGGITFKDEVLLLSNKYDADITNSPYVDPDHPYGRGRLEAQNPNFYQMPNGDIYAFHRYNTFTGEPDAKPWSLYYTSIQYQKSTDGGKNWTECKPMIEYTRYQDTPGTKTGYGLWEPDAYLIDGKLFVYYADTYTPNDLRYQHISYCIYDTEKDSFNGPFTAQNGVEHYSRDGMSVVTKLNDGNYAMVFESTKTHNTDNTFVIKMSLSNDGKNWSRPVIVATPDIVLEKNALDGDKAVCCAPYIITLPDGRVAISYQTTDRYNGVVPDKVSYRIGTEVIVSKDAVTYEKYADISNFTLAENNVNVTKDFTVIENGPGVLSENHISKSASLLYNNGYLMVYYNKGRNTDANTHSINEVMVSYAKLGEKINYNKQSNYIFYNRGGRELVNQNGTYTLPTSTTTMLVANKNAEKPISVSYNKNDYTLFTGSKYTATFDAVNKKITTTDTGKALLKDTETVSSFKANLNVQGNTSSGYTHGGIAFHVQKEDFNANYFNTSGYSVFVKRLKESLNKVEIVYRYCKGGESVYAYSAGSYNELDANDLDITFNLEVVVNEDKFYATLRDENGKVIINAKEAPLNEFRKDVTEYYPVGSLAIITNGKHTISNINITETSELVESNYLKARAVFDLANTGDNQSGFAIRAQGSIKTNGAGYSGYVIKLVKSDDYANGKIGLQLTRYGTDSSDTKFQNLGNMKTVTDTTVLGNVHSKYAKIILEIEAESNILTAKLINYDNPNVSASYTFDLKTKSGTYTDYYENGGYGIFNHGSDTVTVSDIEFETEKSNKEYTLNEKDYTVYQPDNSTSFEYGEFIATEASGKKIMLNDVITKDFTADATFAIGTDGSLKTGIVFRANSLGNAKYDMDSYAVVVERERNGKNNSQFRFVIYKFTRTKTGKLNYYARMVYFNDAKILSSVIPETKNYWLAGAGTKIRINLDVDGNNINSYFEILDSDGVVLATSANLYYDLSTKLTPSSSGNFTSELVNTNVGAGEIGVWVNTKAKFCDFNLETKDVATLNDTLLILDKNEKGEVFTTLFAGSAETGSKINVTPVVKEGYTLFGIKTTVSGTEKLISKINNVYSFTKEKGATTISGIFGIIGDTNGDDLSDSTDLVVLTKVLLNVEKDFDTSVLCDVNQDSLTNVQDLVWLKNSLG